MRLLRVVQTVQLAWRNLWRNQRRSAVTIGAMTLALLLMILYSGLVEGYLIAMEKSVTDLEMGDIQIFAPGYLDKPSLYTRIEEPGPLLEALDRAGYSASARKLAFSLAASEASSAGAQLRGIDIARDKTVSSVHAHVHRGRWLDATQPKGVVIGRRLAKTLDLEVGGELILLSQGADGSMANDAFKILGVLKSIGDATDRGAVFMTSEAFSALMSLQKSAHQVIVRRPSDVPLAVAQKKVSALAEGRDVKTWRQLLPTLSDLMQTQRSGIMVMFLIIYVAIGIIILNAMLMAVFERVREFGVMKALGMGPFGVLSLIAIESAIMTGLSMIIALTLSVPGLFYLNQEGIDLAQMASLSISGVAFDSVLRAAITPNTFIGPIVTFLVVVSLAALYPAIKAALLHPVEAIRHQ